MKKKILTQIMVLSFALGGLFVVGNNVLATDTTIGDLDDSVTWYQSMSFCGSWGGGMKLCCTATPRGTLCSKYECIC